MSVVVYNKSERACVAAAPPPAPTALRRVAALCRGATIPAGPIDVQRGISPDNIVFLKRFLSCI